MLLYLTSEARVNLLDFAENANGLILKKMTGKFSLLQFVIRDMRNYQHIKYFAIDRAAVIEDDGGLIQAVQSFQTMYSARIIVICEGCSENDLFLQQLVMSGVTDIVTATEIEAIQADLLECLSPEGMLRFKEPMQKQQAPSITAKRVPVSERYSFECKNVRIAIAGCQRRVGVTTTAINLANWIQAHGGTTCYLESNLNKHLVYILKLYGEQPEGNHYPVGGVDYYFTQEFDKTYNFIITDCGVLGDQPQASFKDADLRLLCGSAMPYELSKLQSAVKRCEGITVQALGMYIPSDLREFVKCAINSDMLFADPSHELFDGGANGSLNKKLVEGYITGILDDRV